MSRYTFIHHTKLLHGRWGIWFRVAGWGLALGYGPPLPSSKRRWHWHQVGPYWFRVLRRRELKQREDANHG